MMTFNELRGQLKLPLSYEKEANLQLLKAWCQENVSQDITYTGDANEKYTHYLRYVENYLDNFMVNLPINLSEKSSFFGDLNAIHYAADQGYDRFISEKNIPETLINEADHYGQTPLHKAATQGHHFTVETLLNKGADPHKRDAQNHLPIHSALFVPLCYEDDLLLDKKKKIVQSLLSLSPEALSMQDNDGNTLLHLMVTDAFDSLIADIVMAGPKLPFIKNSASVYPIHTAILNQQNKAVDALLAINGVASLTDGHGCLPLHYAARYATSDIVKSCGLATKDLNATDGQKRTPLLWAAYAGNEEAFTTLMEMGADPCLTDYQGFSILDAAKKANDESLVEWILENVDESLVSSRPHISTPK